MALTRKFLTGFGLTEEQVQAIIEAHTETVNALKDQRDEFKEQADKVPALEKTIAELKDADTDTSEWEEKYQKEHEAFETYKQEQKDREIAAAKETAYRDLLKVAGVAEKRIDTILKVTDLSEMKLTKEGKLQDADDLKKSITETWGDFIETTDTKGTDTPTPPEAGGNTSITKEQFAKMGYQSRMKLYNEDPETYKALTAQTEE